MTLRGWTMVVVVALVIGVANADGQTLGTFRWQLQPYCNVLTVLVTQAGGAFRIEGSDDMCGGSQDKASVIGTAFPNPDGSIGFGLNVVSTPNGRPVPVSAEISLTTLNGTWRDGAGSSGSFVFTPGNGAGGSPRPTPASSSIPTAFGLFSDGQFVAKGTFGVGNIPASNIGVRMMWHPAKAAFRAGRVTGPLWDDVNVGVDSMAFGLDTFASGAGSTALGAKTVASGPSSTAMGHESQALGIYSTTMGRLTTAQGQSSTAMGESTVASGPYATVAGLSSAATGTASFAAGYFAEANGLMTIAAGNNVIAGGPRTVVLGSFARSLVAGAFVFGDASTSSILFAPEPNMFVVRAAGGYKLFTNPGLTTGVWLKANESGWNVVSDANMKENFRDLDGGEVLAKIARMPLREWSYKSSSAGIRHVGPTAQDFHAAFGLGGDELSINTIDADGIALLGLQALEARTRHSNDALTRENAALRSELAGLRDHLARIEQQLQAMTKPR